MINDSIKSFFNDGLVQFLGAISFIAIVLTFIAYNRAKTFLENSNKAKATIKEIRVVNDGKGRSYMATINFENQLHNQLEQKVWVKNTNKVGEQIDILYSQDGEKVFIDSATAWAGVYICYTIFILPFGYLLTYAENFFDVEHNLLGWQGMVMFCIFIGLLYSIILISNLNKE